MRAHQKLHEQREAEARAEAEADEENDCASPRKTRRGGEYGRDWKCETEGCTKAFKSVRLSFFILFARSCSLASEQKNALGTHVNVAHLGRRDHLCPQPNCGRTFGYKHLLQRHEAKAHKRPSTSGEDGDGDSTALLQDRGQNDAANQLRMDIDSITGNAYAKRARAQIQATKVLQCPFPDLGMLFASTDAQLVGGSSRCGYVFSRAYDLRRHLKVAHQVEVDRDDADAWVRERRTKT